MTLLIDTTQRHETTRKNAAVLQTVVKLKSWHNKNAYISREHDNAFVTILSNRTYHNGTANQIRDRDNVLYFVQIIPATFVTFHNDVISNNIMRKRVTFPDEKIWIENYIVATPNKKLRCFANVRLKRSRYFIGCTPPESVITDALRPYVIARCFVTYRR